MDDLLTPMPTPSGSPARSLRPNRAQLEQAVRVLLRWAGDPQREGLLDTPKRVVRAYKELFAGYREDPAEYLERVFEGADGYRDIILVCDIELASRCEHHIVPFSGKAKIAYYPSNGVVGLSKLARVRELLVRAL